MKLHILTAVSRPDNLPAVELSIRAAKDLAPDVGFTWHRRDDPERTHVGGQHLKNQMLDRITDGWIVILDDDTTMHPSFMRKVSKAQKRHPDVSAIVVSQKRTTGVVMQAKPENMVVGSVDAGQVILHRDLIGDMRIPETYAGDGEWIEILLHGRDDVHYMPDILSLHNALSGVDVSESPERMGAA